MIIPALLTAGIFGLLYASRGAPAPTGGVPGQLPTPPIPVTPPGMIAQVGDTVEVSPGAIPNVNVLLQQFSIPQNATVTGVFVQITQAGTIDLQGLATGVSYATASGSGSAGVPFGGVPTPPFPRAFVAHVSRGGVQIA